MGNIFGLLTPLAHGVVKLAGLTPKVLEIEPGTLLNIWVPTKKSNKKPVVVFVHGFAVDGILTWFVQAILLSGTYSVYMPDLMFFGKSITHKSDRTTAFQADCLAKGLLKLGVKKCTVVGFSCGAMVALKMAASHPDLVEFVVVSGGVVELTESIAAASLARIGVSSFSELLIPNSVDGVKRMMKTASYSMPWLPSFFFKHFLEVMFDNRKERQELLEALVISDKDATIPNFTRRIHLMWGLEDKIFDMKVAENLNKQLGENSRLEYIERGGHLLHLERPFAYTRCLKKILASFQSRVHLKN